MGPAHQASLPSWQPPALGALLGASQRKDEQPAGSDGQDAFEADEKAEVWPLFHMAAS